MGRMRAIGRALIGLSVAAALASCVSAGEEPFITASASLGGRPDFAATAQPPRNSEHARLIATYGGVYSDAGVERAVAKVVGRLVAASDDPARSYRLTILNSPTVNAFALPSGDLFITRGLLALANDESELAAVIAHEMAHVTAHHAAARQRRAQAVAVANRVLGNVVNHPGAVREAKQSTQTSLARFSQSQELEADRIGVRTLAGAGFDPFAASRFLTSMARFAGLPAADSANAAPSDFLSSHPTTPARIDMARRSARGYAAPGIGAQERDAYLRSLDGLLYGDDPREGFVRGQDFLHADLGIAFTAPDGYTLKNTSSAVLATDGERNAIRFDGVAVPPDLALNDYLRSGWVNGLVEDSVRRETVNGLEAASGSALAGGWSFRIGVVRAGARVYRFILASSAPASGFEASFRTTFESFRRLSAAERAALKPLRVRIITAREGDTVESLARRTRGVTSADRLELFAVLNGLNWNQTVRPGTPVKIITE